MAAIIGRMTWHAARGTLLIRDKRIWLYVISLTAGSGKFSIFID
jgi:hypothetical protein